MYLTKRQKTALLGALLVAPFATSAGLIALLGRPADIGVVPELCLGVLGWGGIILLFVTWITPTGRDPLHPPHAG